MSNLERQGQDSRQRPGPGPRTGGPYLLAAALLAGAVLAGCQLPSGSRGPADLLGLGSESGYRGVWPEPPAQPRIAYLRSFSSPAELGMRLSGWKRISSWVTGKNTVREKFVKPFGIAVDEQDNICLTDTGTAAVWFFDLHRRKFRVWRTVGPYRLISPVAVASRGGVFYVADSALGKVLAFRDPKKLLWQSGEPTGRPAGLTLGTNELFVADSMHHAVDVYDLEGHWLRRLGGRGAAPGRFNFPTHLAMTPDGRLVVTDSGNARVQVLRPDGAVDQVIGGMGDTSGHFSRPKGVAVDAFGHVYVVDAVFDNLQIFDLQGRFLLHIGQAGQGPGEFWLPAGVAVTSQNRILVADSYNHRVQVFEYLSSQTQ